MDMAPLWLSLLTALIAAASALAGAILNNYLSGKEKQIERSIRARGEASDFLINRGEELYLHLDHVDNYISAHNELIQLYCHGRLSFDEFRSLREEELRRFERLRISKSKLIVRAFFKNLMPSYTSLAENLTRLNTLDKALMDAEERAAQLLYRVSADAARLQKLVVEEGDRMRDELAQTLADIFVSRAMPLDAEAASPRRGA